MTSSDLLAERLPPAWSAFVPELDDVAELRSLLEAEQRRTRGSSGVDEEQVTASVAGTGSWTRRQVALRDGAGALAAWCSVHDRAAGRTAVRLVVAPACAEEEAVGPVLLRWAAAAAADIAALRLLPSTVLDADMESGDERLARWFTAAGYHHARTWLHMSRPVTPDDDPAQPRAGVRVRRVGSHADGMPLAHDLQVVHRMLEESFADHFNSYRESFAEFVQRLQESPGHRWDHWWIAEFDDDGWQPGGALVGSVVAADATGAEGSYVDYIGVHASARGRGIAKALLHTVIRDARDRGRNRVDLEVDADSPTGADGLYRAMGWQTGYTTESWHSTLSL